MKSLSESQLAERARLAEAIRSAHCGLEDAIDRFNDQLMDLRSDVEAELATLNEALADADGWLDGVREEMDACCDGDQGGDFDEWREHFFGTGDRIKGLKFPEPIEVPECPFADELEALPASPGAEG